VFRGGTDELDPAALADFGEMRIFGQESIAWMDGLGVRNLGGTDDAGDVEVTAGAFGRSYAKRFIRQLDMGRFDVRRGMNRNGSNPHLFTGT